MYLTTMQIGVNMFVADATGEAKMLEQQKIVEIAKKEIKKLGYDIEIMDIEITFHEQPWNDYFSKENMSEYAIERKSKLENKKYWAVYFYKSMKTRGPVHKGGDVGIFVDAITGKVLTNYRGK